MTEYWEWEVIPFDKLSPVFESQLESFRIFRTSDLRLKLEGEVFANVRPRSFEAHTPGQTLLGDDLEFRSESNEKVSCNNCLREGSSTDVKQGLPTRSWDVWGVNRVEVLTDASPSHLVEWVLNMNFSGLILPNFTEVVSKQFHGRKRPNHDSELNPNLSFQSTRDHVAINVHCDGVNYELNVGKSQYGPKDWLPGFIEYPNGVPPEGVRDVIRIALSFALGCELFLLGNVSLNTNGGRIHSTHHSVRLEEVMVARNAQAAPMTTLHNGGLLAASRLQTLVQGILDSDALLDLEGLRRFYFLARHSMLDIRPALYGANVEYIRDRIKGALPSTLIEKKAYKNKYKQLFESFIRESVDEADLSVGASIEDLIAKLSYFHQTSLSAQTNALLKHLNLNHGEVEQFAMKERNHVAHGRPYESDEYLTLIRHVRALQALNNRIILAITKGGDTYIDYSADGFPLRLLAEALGGPKGDGKAATYPDR